jgi:hypothetical protein
LDAFLAPLMLFRTQNILKSSIQMISAGTPLMAFERVLGSAGTFYIGEILVVGHKAFGDGFGGFITY